MEDDMVMMQDDKVSAFVVVTEKCVLKCRYCFYRQGVLRPCGSINRPPPNIFAASLLGLPLSGAILTGGDPLHPDSFDYSIDLSQELRAKGVPIFIDTALAVTDRKKLNTVVSASFDMIYVSCDSHDHEIHDKQRGQGASTLSGIKYLAERGGNVSVISVITKCNWFQIREMLSYFKSIGVRGVDFNIAAIPKNSSEYSVLSCESLPETDKKKLADDLQWCAEQSNNPEIGRRYASYQASLFLGSAERPLSRCAMGGRFVVVNAQGDISPCFHAEETWGNLDRLNPVLSKIKARRTHPLECASKSCASLFAIDFFWETANEGGVRWKD